MGTDSQKMVRVFELAVDEIEKVLNKKTAITDVTKVASAAMATYSRIRSTEVHEMALRLMIEKNGITQKQLTGGQ